MCYIEARCERVHAIRGSGLRAHRRRVVVANDEFFAPKEFAEAREARFYRGEVHRPGKVMDGWETRRRRIPGCDWCIVRLGLPGILRGAVVIRAFSREIIRRDFRWRAATRWFRAL